MTKTVLVTGADSGLGFSLAKRFVAGGYQVFAGVYRNADQLKTLPSDRLTCIPLNVADMASVQEAARQTVAQTEALDVVINNAGVHLKESPQRLEDLDLTNGQLEQTMSVNAFGPLRVVQQFLGLLEKGSQKLIVNISSEAGSVGDCQRVELFPYCMSKSALNMQSKILQNYLKPRGFKVLALHPGWMQTTMGGPQATMHPDESAENIFQLTTRHWEPDSPIYMDHRGQVLSW